MSNRYHSHRLGEEAERRAVRYLQERGFTLVVCNYRYKKAEIDIIAKERDLLLFVEVKARSSERFGHPEEFVTPLKKQLLLTAAENYIMTHNWTKSIRFDIIAVLKKQGEIQIDHFEDAF
ncbi:MAG: YraN family protein [Cytophagales bacterium]|nr:YraN family protein [Cytophagales bacterium]